MLAVPLLFCQLQTTKEFQCESKRNVGFKFLQS